MIATVTRTTTYSVWCPTIPCPPIPCGALVESSVDVHYTDGDWNDGCRGQTYGALAERAAGDSCSGDFDAGGKTEVTQEAMAILPSKPECPHVGQPQASHRIAHRYGLKIPFHDLPFGPVHQLLQRYAPMQVGCELIDNDLTSNAHRQILCLSVAKVEGELLVNLHKPPRFVVNLLPEADRVFVRVHLLAVTCPPAVMSRYVEPVASSAVGQFAPLPELMLIAISTAHRPMLPERKVAFKDEFSSAGWPGSLGPGGVDDLRRCAAPGAIASPNHHVHHV